MRQQAGTWHERERLERDRIGASRKRLRDRILGLGPGTELDERTGFGEREPAMLGDITAELTRDRLGCRTIVECGRRRHRHDPELVARALEQRADFGCELRDRGNPDRFDRGPLRRGIEARERLAQGGDRDEGRRCSAVIVAGTGDAQHRPRELAALQHARDRFVERKIVLLDHCRRRTCLPPITRERPAQVDAIVVGQRVDRWNRKVCGFGDRIFHRAIEIAVTRGLC